MFHLALVGWSNSASCGWLHSSLDAGGKPPEQQLGFAPKLCIHFNIQWIGLRENLQDSPIFNGKIYGFRLRFSLKPIHWNIYCKVYYTMKFWISLSMALPKYVFPQGARRRLYRILKALLWEPQKFHVETCWLTMKTMHNHISTYE